MNGDVNPFVPGDIVVLKESYYDLGSERLGPAEVICSGVTFPEEVGLSFPNWKHGHDLSGLLKGDRRNTGWWVTYSDIEFYEAPSDTKIPEEFDNLLEEV